MKYHISFIFLILLGVFQADAQTQLHNSYCNKVLPMQLPVTPADNSFNYYEVQVRAGSSTSTVVASTVYTYGSEPTFIELSTLAAYEFEYGVTYYVQTGTSTSSSGPFTFGSFCTVEFENTTRLHNSYCNKEVGMLSTVVPNAQQYHAYEAAIYNHVNCDPSTDLVGTVSVDLSNVSTFLDFAQNNVDLQYGVDYYVRFKTKANAIASVWSPEGPICSIMFANTTRLHNSICGKEVSMKNYVTPNYNTFYDYEAIIYNNINCDPSTDVVGSSIAVDMSNLSTFLEFAQNVTDLDYATSYWVRLKVKNAATTSLWSPEGPICEVSFKNTVHIHNSLCDNLNAGSNSYFSPNHVEYDDYRVNAYKNGVLMGTGDVKLSGGGWMLFADFPASLNCGTYEVRYQVKNTTTSAWSPEGPSCNINLNVPNIIYVDKDATGLDNGTSWVNAYNHLENAIAEACEENAIWVAEGTYYPNDESGISDRTQFFTLLSGVQIYGGFDGTETSSFDLDTRDLTAHPTILSGDLDKNGINDNGNAYRVVYTHTQTNTSYLDGFTIEMGRANLNNGTGQGSDKFKGGGLYCKSAEIEVRNCTFRNNYAIQDGGAVFVVYGTASFINCIFRDNSCARDGGAVCVHYSGSDLEMLNCTFSNNSAVNNYNVFLGASGSDAAFKNCIIWDNGTGNAVDHGDADFTNCIYDGATTTASNVLNSAPLLDANLIPQTGSPAIDPTTSSSNAQGIDIGGNTRIQGTGIDWGAWETAPASLPPGTAMSLAPEAAQPKVVELYPNPSTGTVHIATEQEGFYLVEVIDLRGQVLFNQHIQLTTATSINLQYLESGVYLVRCSSGQEVTTSHLHLLK